MPHKVFVYAFAKQFHGGPIPGAEISDMFTDVGGKTNGEGRARLEAEVGQPLTLVFRAAGFPDVQTATVIVPPRGLMGDDEEITFEVPGMKLYRALDLAFGKAMAGTRHVITTVLSAGSNLRHNYGEPDATAVLVSDTGVCRTDPVYLSAKQGEFKHRTSWPSAILRRRLTNIFPALAREVGETRTTVDGGLIFPDVPCGDYRIVAEKPGVNFSESRVIVSPRSPILVNASPPHGPRVIV